VGAVSLVIGIKWRKFKARRAAENDTENPSPVRSVFRSVCYGLSMSSCSTEKQPFHVMQEESTGLRISYPPGFCYATHDLQRLRVGSIRKTELVSKPSAEIIVAAAESAQRKRSSTVGSSQSAQRRRSDMSSSCWSSQPTLAADSVQTPEMCHLKLTRTTSSTAPDAKGRRGKKSVDPRELELFDVLPSVRDLEEDDDAITPVTATTPVFRMSLPRMGPPPACYYGDAGQHSS